MVSSDGVHVDSEAAPEVSETPFLLGCWYCPYVHRVYLACSAKQWKIKEISIDLKNKPSWFLETSPHGKVPVIVYKEKGVTQIIYESLVLVDFVEERCNEEGASVPSLLPVGSTARAEARITIGRFDQKLVPVFYKMMREKDREAAHALAAESRTEMAWLESRLSPEGPFFMGSTFTSVDAVILPWLLRHFLLSHLRGFDMFAGFERMRAYTEAAAVHPIVTATFKPPEGLDWKEEMKAMYAVFAGTPINLFD